MKGAKAKGYFKSVTENEIYWTTFYKQMAGLSPRV